jgi:hypothetical protein
VSAEHFETSPEPARGGVLCFVEHDEEGVLDASLRALTFARSLASASNRVLTAALVGEVSPAKIETLSQFGVSDAYQLTIENLDAYSPSGWARALAELTESFGVDALVAAGTDRGQEIVAHVGATSGLAMAANCVAASWLDARSIQLSRQRWAGSLIEDAVLEGVPALLTVASDGVLAAPADVSTSTTVHVQRTAASDLDRRVVVREWIGRGGGIALADARVVVGADAGLAARRASPRSMSWRVFWARPLACREPSPAPGGVHMLSRWDRRAPRSRPISTSRAASAARRSTWRDVAARSTWSRSTLTPTRRSYLGPTTPSWATSA